MYLQNQRQVEEVDGEEREIIMEVVNNGLQPPPGLHSATPPHHHHHHPSNPHTHHHHHHHHAQHHQHPQQQQQQQHHSQQMILGDSSGGEDHEVKAPKKRAETWVQEEIKALIALRREMDSLFNTSKSNKHLWDQISLKMREHGFDRSPTMCTDKWRNLLKEYKKIKAQDRSSGSAKMSCYKDLEELLKERPKNGTFKSSHPAPVSSAPPTIKIDGYMHFSPKGDHQNSAGGRVIIVKWGEYTRRIGVDGTSEAIKDAVRCAFGLRTKRAFWLEDEDGVVRCLDRDMPLGTYMLHLDDGLTVKICLDDESDHLTGDIMVTLYTDEDFRDFLKRHGWSGLREVGGFRTIDCLDELRPEGVYQRAGLLAE